MTAKGQQRLTKRLAKRYRAEILDNRRENLRYSRQRINAAETDLDESLGTAAVLGERIVQLSHAIDTYRAKPPKPRLIRTLGSLARRFFSREDRFVITDFGSALHLNQRADFIGPQILFPPDETVADTRTISEHFWALEFPSVPGPANTRHCEAFRVKRDRKTGELESELAMSAFVSFEDRDGKRTYASSVKYYLETPQDLSEAGNNVSHEHMLGLVGRALVAAEAMAD